MNDKCFPYMRSFQHCSRCAGLSETFVLFLSTFLFILFYFKIFQPTIRASLAQNINYGYYHILEVFPIVALLSAPYHYKTEPCRMPRLFHVISWESQKVQKPKNKFSWENLVILFSPPLWWVCLCLMSCWMRIEDTFHMNLPNHC